MSSQKMVGVARGLALGIVVVFIHFMLAES